MGDQLNLLRASTTTTDRARTLQTAAFSTRSLSQSTDQVCSVTEPEMARTTEGRRIIATSFAYTLRCNFTNLHQIQNQYGSFHPSHSPCVGKLVHVESTCHSNGGYTEIMFGDAGTEAGFHWMRAHSDTLFARVHIERIAYCPCVSYSQGQTATPLYVQARSLTWVCPS